MVVLEPLNKLLQAKWDLLIPKFFFNFLCYLIYMFIFTAVAYHQPALEKARAGRGLSWGRPAWNNPRGR
jgi:transient receptor potential cation channel subfamily V protein 2